MIAKVTQDNMSHPNFCNGSIIFALQVHDVGGDADNGRLWPVLAAERPRALLGDILDARWVTRLWLLRE